MSSFTFGVSKLFLFSIPLFYPITGFLIGIMIYYDLHDSNILFLIFIPVGFYLWFGFFTKKGKEWDKKMYVLIDKSWESYSKDSGMLK